MNLQEMSGGAAKPYQVKQEILQLYRGSRTQRRMSRDRQVHLYRCLVRGRRMLSSAASRSSPF